MLTKFQKELLLVVQHDAELSTKEIANILKVEERKVNYHLENLKDSNVIVAKAVFIDLYPIGFYDYQIFFNLNYASQDKRSKFLSSFSKTEGVSWLARTLGDYEFVASILARDINEAYSILLNIGKSKFATIKNKTIVVKRTFRAYPRKYFNPKYKNYSELFFGSNKSKLKIDDLDLRILSFASNNSFKSLRQIAQNLNENQGRIIRRWNALKSANVIKGVFYRLDSNIFLGLSYRILIECNGFSENIEKLLDDYARKNSYVLRFIKNIGKYDYEFDVEVEKLDGVLEITSEIRNILGENLENIKTLQIVSHIKYSSYPFKIV